MRVGYKRFLGSHVFPTYKLLPLSELNAWVKTAMLPWWFKRFNAMGGIIMHVSQSLSWVPALPSLQAPDAHLYECRDAYHR